MNRRQFTASLAALTAAPALPIFAAPTAAAVAPAVPPGAYAWAQLIARAQNTCSPEMLARILHLKPDVAQALFSDMVVDGVLRAPGAGGVARAAQPFDTTGFTNAPAQRLKARVRDMAKRAVSREEESHEQPPLVNDPQDCLVCDTDHTQEVAHDRADQRPQESPERG